MLLDLLYMSGCVKLGSSASLCPHLRKQNMSMTTSLLNLWRYSIAVATTWATASQSSPLTWKMGTWIILATSVG